MKMMKELAIAAAAVLAFAGCSDRNNVTLNGAGASFPAPVYQNWTHSYSQTNPAVALETVLANLTSPIEKVIFCCFSDSDAESYRIKYTETNRVEYLQLPCRS